MNTKFDVGDEVFVKAKINSLFRGYDSNGVFRDEYELRFDDHVDIRMSVPENKLYPVADKLGEDISLPVEDPGSEIDCNHKETVGHNSRMFVPGDKVRIKPDISDIYYQHLKDDTFTVRGGYPGITKGTTVIKVVRDSDNAEDVFDSRSLEKVEENQNCCNDCKYFKEYDTMTFLTYNCSKNKEAVSFWQVACDDFEAKEEKQNDNL